ncbi:MAG: aspartate aminotransferase family protein [Bacteroidales bacterium]|jgi:acetylornithine/succinyldiaminopimelate/putrescine aminotransferase|nr:aspartate aminotransferase family protein [Bacteroidales bacterium]
MNKNLFRRYMAQASDFDPFIIDVSHTEGVYVWDKSGKRYFDFISSICVNNVGHRHPAVMAALHEQMEKYLHVMVYGEFIQQPQIDYVARLCSFLPPTLQKAFLVNSGSEAIEGAIKLARLYNKRAEIISFRGSYHGSTMGAMSALGDTPIHDRFSPLLPQTVLYEYNDLGAIEKITDKTCCVIVEPIQAGTGMTVPTVEFLKAIRQRCSEVGALLIYDEIQTGFGRTGKLFAFEHSGAVPDILCIAKSMGGGMPIGAFVASEELMLLLESDHPLKGHASTFGGHPLSCVAALASLNVIVELLPCLAQKEARIRKWLSEIPQVRAVTGKGLFLAAHFSEDFDTNRLVERLMSSGFISFYPLFNHSAMCLTPPLVATDEEIDEAMLLFKNVVQSFI